MVIVGHDADGGPIDLWHAARDCLRAGRLSAAQECGDQAAEDRRSATAKNVTPSDATFIGAG